MRLVVIEKFPARLLLKAGMRKDPYGHTAYTRHSKTGKLVTVSSKGMKPTDLVPPRPNPGNPHMDNAASAQYISDAVAAAQAPTPEGVVTRDDKKHPVMEGVHKDSRTNQKFEVMDKRPKEYKKGDLVTPDHIDPKRIAKDWESDSSLREYKGLDEDAAVLHYREHEGRAMRVIRSVKREGKVMLEVESVEPEEHADDVHKHWMVAEEVSPIKMVKPDTATGAPLTRQHKYIRREGTKGNYRYIYEEPSGRHISVSEKEHLRYAKEFMFDVPEGTKDQKILDDMEGERSEESEKEWQGERKRRAKAIRAEAAGNVKDLVNFEGMLQKQPDAINDLDAKMAFLALHQMRVLKLMGKGQYRGQLLLNSDVADQIVSGEIKVDPYAQMLVSRMVRAYKKGVIEPGKFFHGDSTAMLCEALAKQVAAYNSGDRGASQLLRTGREFIKENRNLVEAIHTIDEKIALREQTESKAMEAQQNTELTAPTLLKKHLVDEKGKKTPLELMPFQKKMVNYMLTVKKGINGSDTGMGKTLQGITAGLLLKEKGLTKGTVIFADSGVMGGWNAEITNMVEGGFEKNGLMIMGNRDERRAALVAELGKPLNKRKQFYVLPMSILQADPDHPETGEETRAEVEAIRRFCTDKAVIFDEATALKRTTNNTAINASKVVASNEYAWTLNADPMPNNLMELWAQIEMYHPGALPPAAAFEKHFIEEKVDEDGTKTTAIRAEAREALVKLIKPYVYMKFHHDPDMTAYLPARNENAHGVEMKPDQKALYEKAQSEGVAAIMKLTDLNDAAELQRCALSEIAGLQAVALDPRSKIPDYKGSAAKLDQARLILRNHFTKSPDKGAVVLGRFTNIYPNMKKDIMKDLGLQDHEVMIIAGGEGSQKKTYEYRKAMVEGFNSGKIKVLLIGYQAGGRGLNLQKRSNRVIHISDPWNPAAVKQGEARVWRFGNKEKSVDIDTVRVPGTIDDFTQAKLRAKAALNADVLGDADTAPTITSTLSPDEIANIFGTSIEKINEMRRSEGKSVFEREKYGKTSAAKREKQKGEKTEAAKRVVEWRARMKAEKESRVKKKEPGA